MFRFAEIENNESQVIWLDDKPYTGTEKPVYVGIRLQYTKEWCREWAEECGPYHVDIFVIGPDWAPEESMKNCAASVGIPYKEFKSWNIRRQCGDILSAGPSAYLWQETGYNKRKLLRAARHYVNHCEVEQALYKSQNRVGVTGYDWLKGDITCGLSIKDMLTKAAELA
jgi:hypothetical protein